MSDNKKIFIVPNVRNKSVLIKESLGVTFICPENTVMTGRWHSGDENGMTQYEYATLKAIDENGNQLEAQIKVSDIAWSDPIRESSNYMYQAPDGRVIVGRWHSGDENGATKYASATVTVDGNIVSASALMQSTAIKESSGIWFITDARRVIVGRGHNGDETGQTTYRTAELIIDNSEKAPAPEGTMIIPNVGKESATFNENSCDFECPPNTVIVGMFRSGDENGRTIFYYTSLKAITPQEEIIPGDITIEDVEWTTVEHDRFDAPINRVIIGRKHFGDENAPTTYKTGVVKFNGYPTYISDYGISEMRKDNTGWYFCGSYQVITARQHYGDENGNTYYGFGIIFGNKKSVDNPLPFDLVVSLHQDESYYPMIPSDFAILSRFRKHISGGKDKEYNKVTGTWSVGNTETPEYYNIPIQYINTFYSKEPHYMLYNLRPKDDMRLKDQDPVFLQTFDNLCGDTQPNGRVPAYINILKYTMVDGTIATYVDFWLFFGYNDAPKFAGTIHMSHQGDWEHVMVELVDNKIKGAWLSAHGPASFIKADDLNITQGHDGKQQLTVYCAVGSHALYSIVGEFNTSIPTVKDHTSLYGYKWRITDNTKQLYEQPWKYYAGAWGEVGEFTYSTGPLGAWYKRFDFWYEKLLSPLSSIISSDEIIIVPDQRYLSEEHSESEGFAFEAPTGMVMVGRRHFGDENGMTNCMYATLKAIDASERQIDGTIEIVDISWSGWITESVSNYQAPSGFVILGRQHANNASSLTRYKIGRITFNGNETVVYDASPMIEYQNYLESCGAFFQTGTVFLYTGRMHSGNKDGMTRNFQSLVKVKF